MRLRPIGPGVGGLYYSPLLQDAHTLDAPAGCQLRKPEAAAPQVGRLQALRQSFAAGARRFGQRLIEARMAQAEAQIARARALYDADGQLARMSAIGVRYY